SSRGPHRVHRARHLRHAARVRTAGGHRSERVHHPRSGGGDRGGATSYANSVAEQSASCAIWRRLGIAATLFSTLSHAISRQNHRRIAMNLQDIARFSLIFLSATLLLLATAPAQNS